MSNTLAYCFVAPTTSEISFFGILTCFSLGKMAEHIPKKQWNRISAPLMRLKPMQRPSRPPELAMYDVFVIFSSFCSQDYKTFSLRPEIS